MFLASQQSFFYWEDFDLNYIDIAYIATDDADEFELFLFGA